ncbi:glutathione binding-like protein [Neptuniibacter pectenicola]|jgi:GST-like protein|uniref:Glutathione binding-like protein n=1 Tax=Neptuniibacter pectenicola TaxID=1806669 RepID=A0ABU9TNX6_9GAMM|nr:glutathione binding-like protein [Neptuniibacter pectenicola]KXJ53059.1 MAG: glutathione S-transferase [Neptuniibacter sp. Phe_28]|tara:strand:+ start:15945 stop:16562 length:618 start_codon:yes stop_codon:yes gene_type:complete
MIDLYTWGTPNGRKISIMLEALRLPYSVHPINILENDQFQPAFLKISPNNKIPAIVDPEGPNGETVELFESGAILIYLAEKSGEFIPTDPITRLECLQWLMWQMSGFGAFLGQAHHFNQFAKEDVPYAKQRFNQEAQRLWQVLNTQLKNKAFVVGDELSIADFAIYPWAMRYAWQKVDPEQFPHVKAWMDRMGNIEFVQRGMQVP